MARSLYLRQKETHTPVLVCSTAHTLTHTHTRTHTHVRTHTREHTHTAHTAHTARNSTHHAEVGSSSPLLLSTCDTYCDKMNSVA